jgi:hypothetical protein
MFKSKESARDALRRICELDIDEPHIAAITTRLTPQFVIANSTESMAKGQSQLGGTPDLPPGMAWPLRAPDPHTIGRVEDTMCD